MRNRDGASGGKGCVAEYGLVMSANDGVLELGKRMIGSSSMEWYGSEYPRRNRKNTMDISTIHHTLMWKQ